MQNPLVHLRRKARSLPQGPGVYLMRDRLGKVIYVGKAKNLRRRVTTYFQKSRKYVRSQPKIMAMVEMARDLEILDTKSEAEALLLEGKLIKEYRPKYNTDFVDDKQFLLVCVDLQNELPRFRLTRNRKNDGARYYGPFPRAGMLRETLSEMRKRFGILLSDGRPTRLSDGRFKLYDDARAEIFSGQNETTPEEYSGRVQEACSFLEGKAHLWLAELRDEMKKRAESLDFERAAELRDLADSLQKTISKTRRFNNEMPRMSGNEKSDLLALRKALGLRKKPNCIECFDISHVSGTFVVASMVRFVDGKADRRSYRRFKIRGFEGNDDFLAMEEVVGRRYGRLLDEGVDFPDLVVVDGGLGQVGSALKAFLSIEAEPPLVIGLAKKEETIVFPDERGELKLDRRDPALRLLQRIRDEAHRFANRFNAELRSRRIRESTLDDFPGIGPSRRTRLFNHFGTIEKLRKASPEDLRAVEGIGPKLATELALYLKEGKVKK
ncbi:MAG: excinuclease ABC subunit UvrC [Opitutales bacterium]|nr:excinuclease ABC subunit UvrC [Opitutales bacterium]